VTSTLTEYVKTLKFESKQIEEEID